MLASYPAAVPVGHADADGVVWGPAHGVDQNHGDACGRKSIELAGGGIDEYDDGSRGAPSEHP